MDFCMNNSKELKMLIHLVNKSDISSFRKVIMVLIAVINNPRSNVKDLKVIIEKDPSLSARLLRLANSAYYGFGRRIDKIQDAIVSIGFNTVKELALSQKVGEIFQKKEILYGYSRTALWENSVAVGTCCNLIYIRELKKPGDIIYSVGLLHNLGIIIEDQFMQDKFQEALLRSQNEKCNLSEAEKGVIGFDHSIIGGALTCDWNFPEELSAAIAFHHEPDKVDDKFKEIVSVSYISDYICQRSEIGYCDAPYENQIDYENCLKFLKINKEKMNTTVEVVQQIIHKMKEGGWFSV